MIAVEPPGWVGPALPPRDYRPSSLARQLVTLLDELAVERVAYVGWSWGATVGCHVAAVAPERLSALVLLDAGYTDLQDNPAFEERTLEETVALLEAEPFRFATWGAYLEVMRARTGSWRPALEARARAAMREERGEIVPVVHLEAMAAAWDGVAAEPPTSTLPALAAGDYPVLLVVARETVEPEWGAAALARFRASVPRADVETVESAHDLLADAPEETISIVASWLASAPTG